MGNQMFMYAAGLAAAVRLNTELKLGASDYSAVTRKDRPYCLDCFPQITEPFAEFRETFRICPGEAVAEYLLIERLAKELGIFKEILKLSLRVVTYSYGSYKQPKIFSPSDFLNIKDNIVLIGFWESEKFFADIAGTVRRKFTFSPECFDPQLSERVKTCNSVAVHVRRGDKASKKDKFFCSDGRYIKLAIEKLLSLTENPSFFVFSDDIEWCRKNLPLIHDAEYYFVEGRTPSQDMALMSLCRHVIMGPSTFSWWGAWLNEYPGKIVIAPDINFWYKPGSYSPGNHKDLLPERWIKIS